MAQYEIRVSGFGGQGVILAGYIIGRAAAVLENRHATMTQSYGPEARGSSCSCQVIISDDPVTYPYIRNTDVLLSMSQEAYSKFVGNVKPDGLVLIDDELVTPDPTSKLRLFGIPATRLAEQLGKRIVTNMVMLGFFTAASGIISPDAMRKAVKMSVPAGLEELNLGALEKGLEAGAKHAGSSKQGVGA